MKWRWTVLPIVMALGTWLFAEWLLAPMVPAFASAAADWWGTAPIMLAVAAAVLVLLRYVPFSWVMQLGVAGLFIGYVGAVGALNGVSLLVIVSAFGPSVLAVLLSGFAALLLLFGAGKVVIGDSRYFVPRKHNSGDWLSAIA